MTSALYARVSTEGQSYQMQLTDLRAYGKRMDWTAVEYLEKGELAAAVRSLNALTQRNRLLHTLSYLSLPQTKLSAASVLPVPL